MIAYTNCAPLDRVMGPGPTPFYGIEFARSADPTYAGWGWPDLVNVFLIQVRTSPLIQHVCRVEVSANTLALTVQIVGAGALTVQGLAGNLESRSAGAMTVTAVDYLGQTAPVEDGGSSAPEAGIDWNKPATWVVAGAAALVVMAVLQGGRT